jgi:hypothetical protein
VLTALSAHDRAKTIPKLHKAKTLACGLLKWGMCVVTTVVH